MSKPAMTPNALLTAQARHALKGKWGLAIGTGVVYMLVLMASQAIPVAGPIISLLISGAMSIGLASFSLALARGQNAQLEQIFSGFRKFGVGLGAYLLQLIFIILWSLLLIIPGVVAALSYAMTFYIIAEDDSIGPREAIGKSKALMLGNRWKLLCLTTRLSGWAILCLFTLGIGFLWLFPYAIVCLAKFYDDIQDGASPLIAGRIAA